MRVMTLTPSHLYRDLPDPERDPAFYADVPSKRLLAWVVDVIVAFGFTLLAVPLTAFTAIFYFPFLWLLVGFAYRTITIARGSATWGMRFAGIELRNWRGERLDLPQAAMHTGIYTACMTVFPLQIVSVVLMLTTARKQGLPDMALATVALNARR